MKVHAAIIRTILVNGWRSIGWDLM